jgi:short-subunit dehydrogenase
VSVKEPSGMNSTQFFRKYGPWAVVTGCAMGIGAAYVEQLAARGFDIVLVDNQAGPVREHAARLRPRIDVRECVVDLADPAQVAHALDSIADLEIGLLVANAAHAATAPWLEIPLEDKLRQIQVNCVAVTQMVDVLSRAMAERGRGGIIIMSSMAARVGSPLVATYAATKAFDLILAESLWAELDERGIDVLGVMPGATRTPGFEASLGARTKVPAQLRIMEPSDVAREALDALGKQPSIVVGGFNRFANALLQRILPRKMAIGMMAKTTRAMYPK